MKSRTRSPREPSDWRDRDLDRDYPHDYSAQGKSPGRRTEHNRMNSAGEVAEGGRNSSASSGETRVTEQH